MKAETSKLRVAPVAADVKDAKSPLRATQSKKSLKKAMSGQGEELQLPRKLANGNTLPAMEQTKVVVNAYQLDVSKVPDQIYKFELKFFKTVVKKQRDGTEAREEKDISRGPRNDVAMQQKRRCLFQCYLLMLRNNVDFFGAQPLGYSYDCGINFYSIKNLGLAVTEKKDFQIDPTQLQGEAAAYLGGRVEGIRAQLTSVQTLFPRGHDPEDHSVSQFLDILSNQDITHRDNYLFFPSKIFERNSEIELERDPRIMKEGMQKNVRYVGDSEQSAVPILQIDPKKSAFFAESTVVDFLEKFVPGNGPLERRIQDNFRMANKQIKGLVVITTHMNHNRTFSLYGLSQESAREKQFDMQGTMVTVEQYFQQQYTLRLVNSRLPCAVERKPGGQGRANESFYPLEVLRIMPGQRVSIDKQTPQLVEQMIRRCQAMPAAMVANNNRARDQAIIMNSNKHFASHNVRVNTELTQADASVLFPPAIHYSQDGRDKEEVIDPRSGQLNWKIGRHRYLMPAQAPRVWVAIIFQGGVQGANCMRFLQAIIGSANQRGVQLGEPAQYDELPNTNIGLIRERFRIYKENGVNFVMFFTREKLDPVHHTMKQMEIEYPGIVTQHVSSQTMMKAIGDRGAFMVQDNLLLKFNLKMGGINFGLSTSGGLAQSLRSGSKDIMKDQWLAPGRMFIGLDMSHASPQSLYDRQSDIPVSEPTVVGCAYTIGHPVMMRGTYWYQESRVTHIQPEQLNVQLQVALKNYQQNNKAFPNHIFVFRGGVSEGEYQAVLAQEKAAFELAFQALSKEGLKKPQLTIIVVQRQSNYRIVPTRINPQGRPHEQNVKPGTCIDKRVMHPTATEFLMVGHKTIQGTAHPIRCTVVYDTEPRVSLEEVENISYAMCFTHGIVLSPVSVPAPQYSASDLAKRGRNNWKVRKEEEEDRGSQGSGRFQLQQGIEPQHFFLDMSQRMEPRAPTKFWA